MNVATLQPPGVVDVEFVPGPTTKVLALGALTTTIPDPPAPQELPGVVPPPPLPVLTVPDTPATGPRGPQEFPPLPPPPLPPAP